MSGFKNNDSSSKKNVGAYVLVQLKKSDCWFGLEIKTEEMLHLTKLRLQYKWRVVFEFDKLWAHSTTVNSKSISVKSKTV